MSTSSTYPTTRAGASQERPGARTAYSAAGWAALFAAASFYWAAGGELGVDTLGGEVERQARERDSGFIALTWITGALKLAAGGLVLALVAGTAGARVRRALAWLVLAAGALFCIYGAASLVQHALMAAGAVDKGGLDSTALAWHLALWDPYWLAGGVLFVLAALRSRAPSRLGASRG